MVSVEKVFQQIIVPHKLCPSPSRHTCISVLIRSGIHKSLLAAGRKRYGLVQTFVLVGRPYFHNDKTSKYAWHCIGLITKEWRVLQKTEICVYIKCEMHFQRIRKYQKDKMKVRKWGKYKNEDCVHVTTIDGKWKPSFCWLRDLCRWIKKLHCKLSDLFFTCYCWGYGLWDVRSHLHRKILVLLLQMLKYSML